MNTSPLKVCSKCNRQSYCLYPCDDAYNEANDITGLSPNREEWIKQMLEEINLKADILYGKDNGISEKVNKKVSKNKNTRNNNEIIDEFMEDLLEYTVDQEEYLQVVNGLRKPSDAINWKYLLEFMSDRNEIYSEGNGLCKTCHSELVEVDEDRGEHFGFSCEERVLVCRNGC